MNYLIHWDARVRLRDFARDDGDDDDDEVGKEKKKKVVK